MMNVKQYCRRKIPCIAIIGEHQSGKSQLLEKSGLGIHLIAEDQYIKIWENDTAYFIELHIPSQNLTEFCEQLHTLRKIPFNFLIITVNLAQLLRTSPEVVLANSLRFLETFLTKHSRPLETLVAITQTDRLYGFNAFFGHLTTAEKEQLLGIGLRPDFTKNYAHFIHYLNQGLIERIHHEPGVQKRLQLQLLPIQFAKLGGTFEKILAPLQTLKKLQVQGLYLTSSCRIGDMIHCLTQKTTRETWSVDQPLFIQDLLTKSIEKARLLYQKPAKIAPRLISYAIALTLVILAGVAWNQAYQTMASALTQAEHQLADATRPKDQPKLLSRLNTLNNIQELLDQKHLQWYRLIGLTQAKLLSQETKDTYQEMLTHTFKSFLETVLLSQISLEDNNPDKLNLYRALKTAVMLMPKNQAQLDKNYVLHWYQDEFNQLYPNQPLIVAALLKHTKNLLAISPVNWAIDSNMIAEARARLRALGGAQLIWFQVNEYYPNEAKPILMQSDHLAENINTNALKLESLYSTENFKKIFQSTIPMMVDDSKADFVLGMQKNTLSHADKLKLIEETRQLYLHHYSLAWVNLIAHIQLNPPETAEELTTSIHLLTDKKSLLYQLLNIMIENIELNKDPGDSYHTNPNYLAIKNFLTAPNADLNDLLTHLDQITLPLNTTDAPKIAFTYATNRIAAHDPKDLLHTLMNASKTFNTPINQWINTLATGTWSIVLANSKTYLNHEWSTQVMPEYNEYLQGKYPLFNSKDDISLTDFTHFFGPGGTIDTFFNTYLHTFVNMENNYWTFKSYDHQTIPIPQSILDMFIRASLIQQMFFTDNPQQIGFHFSLLPINLGPRVESLSLNLEGQFLQFTAGGNSVASVLSWPGVTPGTVTLRFNIDSGDHPTFTLEGPWAWFRLLSESRVDISNNPTRFNVVLQLNGYSATYQLIADNRVNPLLPGILMDFRCPSVF